MSKRTEVINSLINRYYPYWAIAVFVVTGLLFWEFLFAHQYESLQTSGVLQHSQLLGTISEREQYLRDLETMKTNFTALDHRLLRDLPVVLPNNYTQADVFTEIEQMFSGTELSVRSINVAAVASAITSADEVADDFESTTNDGAAINDVYEIVQITVSASANAPAVVGSDGTAVSAISYGDFKEILRRLEQYRHLMNLEQLVYTPDSDNFTLILKTYQQKPAAVAAVTESL